MNKVKPLICLPSPRRIRVIYAYYSLIILEQILCLCGCGQKRDRYDNRGRERRYIGNHGGIKTRLKSGHSNSKLDNNARWKGGRTKNVGGYVLIKQPNHPYCNKSGYVFEHRLVMEEYLGRYLTKQETIHHKNGIKTDNRIENLQLFNSHSEHVSLHRKEIDWNNVIRDWHGRIKTFNRHT